MRLKIDWARLIVEGNLPFLLCFTLYLRAISKYKPPGGLYLEGRFNGGFFALLVSRAYTWRGLFSEFYSISTHQTLIRRKTLRFPRSFLSQNVTHRIQVVTKYQDFYHCGIWLHHHNSRGFHVRFYSVKQCLTPTTYFFMF